MNQNEVRVTACLEFIDGWIIRALFQNVVRSLKSEKLFFVPSLLFDRMLLGFFSFFLSFFVSTESRRQWFPAKSLLWF